LTKSADCDSGVVKGRPGFNLLQGLYRPGGLKIPQAKGEGNKREERLQNKKKEVGKKLNSFKPLRVKGDPRSQGGDNARILITEKR